MRSEDVVAREAVQLVAQAMIDVMYTGKVSSVVQLAACVTKANRFLHEREMRFAHSGRGEDGYKRFIAIESDVLLQLCSRFASQLRSE